ncbi:hypothetical protein AAFF_G00237990 [Aldrovandia affinis]|uniref:Uncharacterized protein n=1 Tax=Aldrovandia affinis TaxID=143900 RepID=A0AAD7RE85_9TELE|nr:hypothetical protein AAFF_G00237990 [Aldrovandia affinis]
MRLASLGRASGPGELGKPGSRETSTALLMSCHLQVLLMMAHCVGGLPCTEQCFVLFGLLNAALLEHCLGLGALQGAAAQIEWTLSKVLNAGIPNPICSPAAPPTPAKQEEAMVLV